MVAGSCICTMGISKYQIKTTKVARKGFNIGEVWNLVCCHGNKTVRLILWCTFSTSLLQRFKHFGFKLAKISFSIIFETEFGVEIFVEFYESTLSSPVSSYTCTLPSTLYSTDQKKPNRERERERVQNGYRTGTRTGTERV